MSFSKRLSCWLGGWYTWFLSVLVLGTIAMSEYTFRTNYIISKRNVADFGNPTSQATVDFLKMYGVHWVEQTRDSPILKLDAPFPVESKRIVTYRAACISEFDCVKRMFVLPGDSKIGCAEIFSRISFVLGSIAPVDTYRAPAIDCVYHLIFEKGTWRSAHQDSSMTALIPLIIADIRRTVSEKRLLLVARQESRWEGGVKWSERNFSPEIFYDHEFDSGLRMVQ